MKPWANVVLSGNAYLHPDGHLEGVIHADHVSLGGTHYVPDERVIHFSLAGRDGELTVFMGVGDAEELAAGVLRATEPAVAEETVRDGPTRGLGSARSSQDPGGGSSTAAPSLEDGSR
jgi:hypothetical protein